MNIEEFKKIELKVGTILSAERVEGSEKLVKLSVDLGEKEIPFSPSYEGESEGVALPLAGGDGGGADEEPHPTSPRIRGGEDAPAPKYRQILAGIAKDYPPEGLVGRQAIFVANLEPRQLMGLESQGMILAVTDAEGKVVLLKPDRAVPPGSQAH